VPTGAAGMGVAVGAVTMRTTPSALALVVVQLVGCTAPAEPDELAGETDEDGESGKGDAADSFTFFTLRPDVGACTAERCRFFAARANRRYTNCGAADGWIDECVVDKLDLAGTGFSAAEQRRYLDRLWSEEKILVRGELTHAVDPVRATLAVTELWIPALANPWPPPEGTYVRLRDDGQPCVDASCARVTEHRINSSRTAAIHVFEFDYVGLPPDELDAAIATVRSNDGVIVIGERFYRDGGAIKGRRANQLFRKATAN
jgi:hypothetical protein